MNNMHSTLHHTLATGNSNSCGVGGYFVLTVFVALKQSNSPERTREQDMADNHAVRWASKVVPVTAIRIADIDAHILFNIRLAASGCFISD